MHNQLGVIVMSIIVEALGINSNDPVVRDEQQDFHDFADAISVLVERRRSLGLTQAEVARRMNTKQSAVAAIESSSANPSVQRLQRYARAVEARLTLAVQVGVDTQLRVVAPLRRIDPQRRNARPDDMESEIDSERSSTLQKQAGHIWTKVPAQR